ACPYRKTGTHFSGTTLGFARALRVNLQNRFHKLRPPGSGDPAFTRNTESVRVLARGGDALAGSVNPIFGVHEPKIELSPRSQLELIERREEGIIVALDRHRQVNV